MKNYVVTGSTGHISKPVIKGLVAAGKSVKVVTSSVDKVREIEALGATAAVGSLFDAAFVKSAFTGADAVYTMIPPIWQTSDWRASQREISQSYADAIRSLGIRYVVVLSSIGAHLQEGCGPVTGLYEYEQMLNKISGLNVKFLRPAFFYYNYFNQVEMLRQAGIMGGNYGLEGQQIPLVDTDDIARVALEELSVLKFNGSSVRYIVSDRRTAQEIVEVLGKAIGKKFPWVVFTDEQQKDGMVKAGLPETHADGFVEMGAAMRSGKMVAEALTQPLEKDGLKLEEFAKTFAGVYKG